MQISDAAVDRLADELWAEYRLNIYGPEENVSDYLSLRDYFRDFARRYLEIAAGLRPGRELPSDVAAVKGSESCPV